MRKRKGEPGSEEREWESERACQRAKRGLKGGGDTERVGKRKGKPESEERVGGERAIEREWERERASQTAKRG